MHRCRPAVQIFTLLRSLTNDKLKEKSCDLRVMVGGDIIRVGTAGKKRGPLYSDLNKMAWICHSVYPSVWSNRGTHTQHNNNANKLGRPLCCFFVCGTSIWCIVFQISFIKLTAAPTLILAMFPKRTLSSPLPPSNHFPPPAQITTPSSLGSMLLSALFTPLLLITLFIFRLLIGSPARSCKPLHLPLVSSFA